MTSSASGQDEPNSRCDWLPERARWSYLARSEYGLCPARKFIMFRCFIPYDKFFIDQACSVKMPEYWPWSFFFNVFMDLFFVSVYKHAKLNIRYPAISRIFCKIRCVYNCTCIWCQSFLGTFLPPKPTTFTGVP